MATPQSQRRNWQLRRNLRWIFVAGLFGVSLSFLCEPSPGCPSEDGVPIQRVDQ